MLFGTWPFSQEDNHVQSQSHKKNSDFSFSWRVCEKQGNTENMLRKIIATQKMTQNLISFES